MARNTASGTLSPTTVMPLPRIRTQLCPPRVPASAYPGGRSPVRRSDQRRGARARHEEALRAAVAAGTDMAVGVEHFVRGEDTARGDEILNQRAARPQLGHQRLAGDPLTLLS